MSQSIPVQPGASDPVQILVVEDERLIALNLKECLETLGYQVGAIADTATKAIAQAAELRPNLVLMDIRLKGEPDGIHAAEQIWNVLQIPVIYMTGHSDQPTLERAKVTAPFGYLLKPFKEKALYIAIEAALQRYEREQLMLSVFRGMGDGVIVADMQRRVQYLNAMAERLTGWTQTEAKQRSLFEVFHIVSVETNEEGSESSPSTLDDLITAALQQDTPIFLDKPYVLVARDETVIPIADSLVSLRDGKGNLTGIVIVFRDITEQILAQETERAIARNRQLAAQMEAMEKINQMKEDFLATTSHEMRTPLANIKMAIRLLEISLEQQGLLNHPGALSLQPIARYLKILNQECDQELTLINDLLDLRSLEAHPTPLDISTIQVADWLPHLMEGFQERILQQQQTLTVQIAPHLPPLVTELASLTRLMSELIHNACKYTPTGEQIVVTVDSSLDPDNQPAFRFEIRNSGIEIDPTEQSRIFTPFYRIAAHDIRNSGGTGLGLALVKKLAARLQGTIQMMSQDHWTVFSVCIAQQLSERSPL